MIVFGMVRQNLCLFLIFIVGLQAKVCKDGETMCLGNLMQFCSPEGYWVETECPSGYSCNKDRNSISCIKKGGKSPSKTGRSEQKKSPKPDAEDANSDSNDDSIEIEPSASENSKAGNTNKTRTVTITKKLGSNQSKATTSDKSAIKEPQSEAPDLKIPKEFQFDFAMPSQNGANPVVFSMVFQRSPDSNSIFQQKPTNFPFDTKNMNPTVSNVPQNSGSQTTPPSMPTIQTPTTQPNINPAQSQSGTGKIPSSGSAPSPSAPSSVSAPTPSSATAPSAPSSGSTPAPSTPSASSGGSASSDASKSGTSSSSNAPTPSPSSGGAPSSKSDSSSSSRQSGQSGGSSGGGQMITAEKLTAAMKASGFSPNEKYIEAIVKGVNEKYKDKEMVAMMLAQFGHESGGYAHVEEIACKNGCPGQYGTGAPGKSYHGRGFIQLSWPDNYKQASEYLKMGTKLYDTPEIVATDLSIAAGVSFWFWDKKVATAPGVSEKKQFGLTTKAINGELECKNNANIEKSKKRYTIYKAIAKEMGITNLASESGCYS